MAWRRFYVGKDSIQGDDIRLRGDLVHHIRDVCRFGVGDQFEVLVGDGLAVLARIESLDNRELHARRVSERPLALPPKPHIVLALSVPKLPKVDWIVEKCVELGVAEIRPFVSDYSFLRKLAEISENRLQRWHKLVQGATQQSGRGDLMRIHPPVTLENLLVEFNRTANAGGLFPYEGEARLGLKAALQEQLSRDLDQLWVFVGSEGGFSTIEVARFAAAGLPPVSLGDQILRVETACLALVSIIKYEVETLAGIKHVQFQQHGSV